MKNYSILCLHLDTVKLKKLYSRELTQFCFLNAWVEPERKALYFSWSSFRTEKKKENKTLKYHYYIFTLAFLLHSHLTTEYSSVFFTLMQSYWYQQNYPEILNFSPQSVRELRFFHIVYSFTFESIIFNWKYYLILNSSVMPDSYWEKVFALN